MSPDFAAACREATGGNPFLLGALLRDIAERGVAVDAPAAQRVRSIGPAAVARAVLLRLSGRPPAATALVRSVAVLGDERPSARAAHAAGLPEDEGEASAGTLISLGLLQAADGLEFVHPIVREAVYADISPLERADAHARAASLLAERGASDERVAAQLFHAPPIGDLGRVELLRRAAATALAQGAPSTAATWLERALAEPPPASIRGDLLLELSSARLRLGTPEAAIEPLTTAIALIEERTLRTWAIRLLGSADLVGQGRGGSRDHRTGDRFDRARRQGAGTPARG